MGLVHVLVTPFLSARRQPSILLRNRCKRAYAEGTVALYAQSYCPVNHWVLGSQKQILNDETYTLRVEDSTG
jgi:hypothetical protein